MRKRHSAPRCGRGRSFHERGVCKVPLSPKIERETPLPRAFQQLPFLSCWQRKVPVCTPKVSSPGERVVHSRTTEQSQHKTNLHTDTHRDTKVNDRSSSSNKPPTLGLGMRLESHGPAGLPLLGRCAASLPSAPRAYGLGSSSRPGKAPAALRGLPLLKLQPLGCRGLRRPRWLCSRGSCLSTPACRSRSARARRLPGRPPPPLFLLGRPQGFSVGVRRS